MLAGFLDGVVVVAGALDDAGVAALAALVQVLRVSDAGHDTGEGALALVRGKGRAVGPAADDADGALELDRSGPMPAAVAAAQIRALMA
jgi:hypothetical protein